MKRIGYFEYIRKYAKLSSDEPRINNMGNMFWLLIPPIILGASLHLLCVHLFSSFAMVPEPDSNELLTKMFLNVLFAVIIAPFVTFNIMFNIYLKNEIKKLEKVELKKLRREMLFTHMPLISFCYICVVFVFFICNYYEYVVSTQLIYIYGYIIVLAISTPVFVTMKKIYFQIPDDAKTALPIKTHLWQLEYSPIATSRYFGQTLITCALLLVMPVIVFYQYLRDFDIFHFIGLELLFLPLSCITFLAFKNIIKKLWLVQESTKKITLHSGTALEEYIDNLNDFDLCLIFSNFLDSNDKLHSEILSREMRKRDLLVSDEINKSSELFLFSQRPLSNKFANMEVAEKFIIMKYNKRLIRIDMIESAKVFRNKLISTDPGLEVKFRCTSFNDKFVVYTNHLDQWLPLFERHNIPVEDIRKK